jgi:helicase
VDSSIGPAQEDLALLTVCATPDVEAPPGIQPALDWFSDYSDFDASAIARATVLKAWISEFGEGTISDRFGAAPGDIYVLSDSGSWVAEAASQLAAMMGKKAASATFLTLSERIRHGVRPELLPLVWLPGVGRVRARALYNAGYRRPEDLAGADIERLSSIHPIGPVAAKIIEAAKKVARPT